ncbi:10496_t:CDS:2 [Dentiscutata heterogama]|uniref:10496_t:CDS:1 n=1 Tax=Dentiscutata heterogama TaxID=1316150 RepID=A0ACA9KZH3_9GLOM|nr:10496_t:CDS:2 [Dentiscutata heterogama]
MNKDKIYKTCCLFWCEIDRDSPKEKESLRFRRFRMFCLFIVYCLIIAYIINYLLSFSGPSTLQMSRSIADVPVPLDSIDTSDTSVTSDCSQNIQNYTDYFVYLSNTSFSSLSTVGFEIYTVDLSNSSYPIVILLDSATYTQFGDYFTGGSISTKGSKTTSNIQDKLSSIVFENFYTLSPFQYNYIFLERILYSDLDTSLDKARFTKVVSKSSKHRVKYFGLSTKIFSLGQYSNADFPNVTIPYTTLQISNMSSILTTYTQVNKVSSTTVIGFLTGLGGATAFLLVIYKFLFGGYKPPGLLKPFLPEEWTTMSAASDEEAPNTKTTTDSKG